MRFFPNVVAVATAALLLVPGAQAAPAAQEDLPNLTNPTQVVDTIVAEDLAQLVREIGGVDVQVRESNGKKGISFKDGDIPYNMAPVFCDVVPGKCLAFVMAVIVDNSQLNFTLDTLNSANRTTSFLTFFREENSKFIVGRVNLVDGGVTRKNIGMHIALFAHEFRESMKRLQTQLTVSLDRPAPYQRVAYGPTRIRALYAAPQYVAHIAETMEKDYARRFRH